MLIPKPQYLPGHVPASLCSFHLSTCTGATQDMRSREPRKSRRQGGMGAARAPTPPGRSSGTTSGKTCRPRPPRPCQQRTCHTSTLVSNVMHAIWHCITAHPASSTLPCSRSGACSLVGLQEKAATCRTRCSGCSSCGLGWWRGSAGRRATSAPAHRRPSCSGSHPHA